MRIYILSLAAGLILTSLVYFLLKKMDQYDLVPFYSGEMIVKVEQDTTRRKFSLKQTQEVLKKRLETALVPHRIEQVGKQKLKITFLELLDTSNLYNYIISRGDLGFWELYSMNELSPLVSAMSVELNKEDSLENALTKTKKEDLSPEISSLLDTMRISKENETARRIEFAKPMKWTHDGPDIYPAEIASVLSTDTAWFRTFIEKGSIKTAIPFDARICFSSDEDSYGRKEIYVIKTNYRREAILKNQHIETARTEFDIQNKPFITLRFKKTGIPIWEIMTTKNQGRHIAIVVDDEVISAPLVEGPIKAGETRISGSFSAGECQVMSDLFKNEALPVRIQILSRKFSIPPASESGNRQTILLFTFLFFSGLAFFIFKILSTSKTPR